MQITAALKLGDLGYKVYLIEREPYIGGKVAKLVKTFPTDDCAMCTMSPRLNDVSKHPNVELLAYSDIIGVDRIQKGYNLAKANVPAVIWTSLCLLPP